MDLEYVEESTRLADGTVWWVEHAEDPGRFPVAS